MTIFWLSTYFWINWVSWILCWILWKKIIRKIEYSRSLVDPENYWCGHQLPDNSGKPKSVDSKWKNSCNWGEKFLDYLKRKDFLRADRKTIFVHYWWTDLCLQHYFGDHEDLHISSSLFYFSFVIDNAKPQLREQNIFSCIL